MDAADVEPVERGEFAVADLFIGGEPAAIIFERGLHLIQVLVDVRDPVKRGGLPLTVAHCPEGLDRLPVQLERRLTLPEERAHAAERRLRQRTPPPVFDLRRTRKGLAVVFGGPMSLPQITK